VDLPRRIRLVGEAQREVGVVGEGGHGDTISGGVRPVSTSREVKYQWEGCITNVYQ
jgi:hypothetical protein